jgi:arylsulfatase A-like enzyme
LPRILGTTAIGRWIVAHAADSSDIAHWKWTDYQSRDARGISAELLDWLARRPHRERPFFAFLNYMDAHEPFVLTPTAAAQFETRRKSRAQRTMLRDYWELDKNKLTRQDVAIAQESYEDCISYLDHEIGALLDRLDKDGVLRQTLVIITSDHGEEFGERGVFTHGYSLSLRELHVPLLLIGAGGVPGGRVVEEPVSLRDVPATVVDLLGLAASAPFPGRSLAVHWRSKASAGRPSTSPALSEALVPVPLPPERGRGPTQRGYAMSLVTRGSHYILDGAANEELYDFQSDAAEAHNLKRRTGEDFALRGERWTLRELLRADPLVTISNPGDSLQLKRIRALALRDLLHYRAVLGSLVGSSPVATGGDRPRVRY